MTAETVSPTLLASEKWDYFTKGLDIIFKNWTALQLAADDLDKANELRDITLDHFKELSAQGDRVEVDSLEYNFYCWFEDEAECSVEDGSLLQVATDLVALHTQLMQGDTAMALRLMAAQPTNGTAATRVEGEQDSDLEPDAMQVEPVQSTAPSKPEPVIDEDGKVFHMNCINKWASSNQNIASASAADASFSWRCPGCQHSSKEIPRYYSCFCGKQLDPKPYGKKSKTTPHACGGVCGKAKSCSHPCEIPCHPGPCPECNLVAPPMPCVCGKATLTLPCSEVKSTEFVAFCGQACGKALNCPDHRCQKGCHAPPCAPCAVQLEKRCFCGNDTRTYACGTDDAEPYSCHNSCPVVFDCGKHSCAQQCHDLADHQDTVCPFDPSRSPSCPCGKMVPSGRESCEDPIPPCGEQCGKQLACGHSCQELCHDGPCPTCPESALRTCRCGRNTSVSIACALLEFDPESGAQNPVLCAKVCQTKLQCGRHVCNEKCCEKAKWSHKCDRLCGKTLSCKTHTCLMSCSHEGNCHDLIYPPIPCGTEPPECNQPCRRTRPCGHFNYTPHYCHADSVDCPPCMVFVTKSCACGKKQLQNRAVATAAHASATTDPAKMPRILVPRRVVGCGQSEYCKEPIQIGCLCGHRKQTVVCGIFTENQTPPPSMLECDDSCARKKRAENMAQAFKIDLASTSAIKSGFVGWPEHLVKAAHSFLELVVATERQLELLINNPAASYYYFPKQRLAKANSIINDMVEAYGFLSEWVDQNIGKGTIIARRVPGKMAVIPPKLLSQLARSYSPLSTPQDQYVIPSHQIVAPPSWNPNGFYFSGLAADMDSVQLETLLSSTVTDKPDLRLFWLTDASCFVFWDRKQLEEQEARRKLEQESQDDHDAHQVAGEGIATGTTVEPTASELEATDIPSAEPGEDGFVVVGKPLDDTPAAPSLAETLTARLAELGWSSEPVVEISVSPLGGVSLSSGHIVGQARKRDVTLLREPKASSEWTAVSNWKQQSIPLTSAAKEL
ncbi:FKBP12-associated protein [Kappamyces sp. JEL0680]|nr:FKBP12-associated protein [Kappamyces sp. JEL0680]